MRIFVIAYSKAEADHWIKSNIDKRIKQGTTTISLSEYVYVDDAIRIRGIRDPHGVFVGRWRERLDIVDIVENLLANSVHVNKELQRIRDEITPRPIKITIGQRTGKIRVTT